MTAAMAAATGVAITTGQAFDMTANSSGDLSGFNDGPGPDYGSLSPANYEGVMVVAFRYEDDGGNENFKVALLGTGRAQSFFTRVVIAGSNWDESFLTADTDTFDDMEQGVQTAWHWDMASHAVFTDTNSYTVTLFP